MAEEKVVKAEETKKTEKKNVIASKFGKQEKVDVPVTNLDGEETGEVIKALLNYPGTQAAQKLQDTLQSANGYYNLVDFYQGLMKDVILKPKVSYEYFDKKIKEADKTKQIKVAGVTYDLKFKDFHTAVLVEQFDPASSPDSSNGDFISGLMEEVVRTNGKKTNFDYWDKHDGYLEVMAGAGDFLRSRLETAGFMSLMNAAARFLITTINK